METPLVDPANGGDEHPWKYCHVCEQMGYMRPTGSTDARLYFDCKCGATIDVPRARPRGK